MAEDGGAPHEEDEIGRTGEPRRDAANALAEALGWAVDEGMSVPGLLTPEAVAWLLDVFSGRVAWSASLYDPLRVFAHVYFRLCESEGLPLLTLGDALAALNEMAGGDATSWTPASVPSRETMEALRVAHTSKGIAEAREDNRRGWLRHARKNKSLVLRAAKQLPGRSAAVIGAGQAFDLPLHAFAERYERLVLVDIDEAALTATVDRLFGDSPLRERLDVFGCDVTGIAEPFTSAVREAVARAPSVERAGEELVRLLTSYRFREPPLLFPTRAEGASRDRSPVVDTVYSCMVLSQLATPLTAYVESRVVARFGSTPALLSPEFRQALAMFTHLVQHAHVEALARTGATFVLSSDVSERQTTLSSDGTEIDASPDLPLVAAERLDELVPALQARALATAEWRWNRIATTPAHGGSILQVHGTVARSRSREAPENNP